LFYRSELMRAIAAGWATGTLNSRTAHSPQMHSGR